MPPREDPQSTNSDWLTRTLGRSDGFTRAIQAVLGVAGVLGTAGTLFKKNPLLLGASIVVLIVAAAWVGIGTYLRRRRPKRAVVSLEPRSTSSYFRSLLPFEKGDRLLGRDLEVGQLLVLLRSLEYRFGFLSGEAGAGKTSLLRARIVPELEKEERHVVYVPRTGSDPEAAIRKELILSAPWTEQPAATDSLGELCRKAMMLLHGKTLVLIVDQFEEYFVARPTPGNQERFEGALEELSATDHGVRVLFSLRKEFVDDLLDLAKVIPSLQSTQWRLPLRNFPTGTAREILRRVAQEESLPFSDELQDMVISDLTRDERVRPVEFQIVLTTLLTQGVGDLTAYRSMQGAQGVIARFVSDVIEPPDHKLNEVERTVARQTLRALCNKQFTTRRPVGLTRPELLERMLAEMQASAGLAVSRAQIEDTLDRVLRRLSESYILILEDRERFNLIHDYLASPVRDATAGMETVEERANRMLEQYIEQARVDPAVVMPWKTVRLVQRFAGGETLIRSDAGSLLRRSRLRHYSLLTVGALAGLSLVTLLLPRGVGYPLREQIELRGRHVISRDGRLLLTSDKRQVRLCRLDRSRFQLHNLLLPIIAVIPSPSGDSLLALGADDALYRVRIEGDLKPERLIDRLGWGKYPYLGKWAGFSANGAWSFATSADGRVYVWPALGRPREILQVAFTDVGSEPVPPLAGLTANGKWLWVIDHVGHLYVVAPNAGPANPDPVVTLFRDFGDRRVAGNSSGDWLAVTDGSGQVQVIHLTGSTPRTPAVALRLPNPRQKVSQLWFSPDGQWLLAEANGFYTARISERITFQTFPAIDLSQNPNDVRLFQPSREVSFTSTYASASDQLGQVYIWQLKLPPRAYAKPALEQDTSFPVRAGQRTIFCPNNTQVLLSNADGSIHSARLTKGPLQFKQIGRLRPFLASFRMAKDGETIFAYNSMRLAAGTCDELIPITEQDSDIEEIATDGRGNLVLITDRGLLRLGRAFYLWGLPIWPMGWPEILPRPNYGNE